MTTVGTTSLVLFNPRFRHQVLQVCLSKSQVLLAMIPRQFAPQQSHAIHRCMVRSQWFLLERSARWMVCLSIAIARAVSLILIRRRVLPSLMLPPPAIRQLSVWQSRAHTHSTVLLMQFLLGRFARWALQRLSAALVSTKFTEAHRMVSTYISGQLGARRMVICGASLIFIRRRKFTPPILSHL